MEPCLRWPMPPNLGLSTQLMHLPQSPELHPRHWPHRAERIFLPLITIWPMPPKSAGDGARVVVLAPSPVVSPSLGAEVDPSGGGAAAARIRVGGGVWTREQARD